MGKTRGPYNEEYPMGTLVKVASREALEEFLRTWKYHNKLSPEQLEYAGKTGKIKWLGFYHGGDELYQMEGIPGIWHEECLKACEQPVGSRLR
jgi:hypothetical protein